LKSLISTVFVTAVFLLPQAALGQKYPKTCSVDKPGHCVQPLEKGEVAPFTGQLYTVELALDHSDIVHNFKQRLKLEASHLQAGFAIRLQGARRFREIDAEASKAREKLYLDAIEDASPSWYERPAFMIPVTIVVTAGVILAVFAIAAEYGQLLWAPNRNKANDYTGILTPAIFF
jgi:hypothetical protein